MSNPDVLALWLTLQLAGISTIVLLVLGTPLAWWLANSSSRLMRIVEIVVALPLVLPPTVLGFYLLIALGREGALGKASMFLRGEPLAFTFEGLVIGSIVYSLPFVVHPLKTAFTSIEPGILEAAATLRASPWDRFWSITLPLTKPAFVTAGVLAFAHTIGEFGVVLMIGGNIPGETQVLSIALYNHVEALDYTQAHVLSGVLLLLASGALWLVLRQQRKAALQ